MQESQFPMRETFFTLKVSCKVNHRLTHVHGISCSASPRHEKVIGSMLSRVFSTWCLAFMLKSRPRCSALCCTYCCYFRSDTLIVRIMGNALAPNRCNSLSCIVRTSRQRSCYQRVGCLLCSMARINDIWDWSLDKRKVRSLIPHCGQDGYLA